MEALKQQLAKMAKKGKPSPHWMEEDYKYTLLILPGGMGSSLDQGGVYQIMVSNIPEEIHRTMLNGFNSGGVVFEIYERTTGQRTTITDTNEADEWYNDVDDSGADELYHDG